MVGGDAVDVKASLDHFKATLSRVEALLERRPLPAEELLTEADASISFGSYGVPQQAPQLVGADAMGSGWAVGRAFLVLGYLLNAVIVPTDTAAISHFTEDPSWVRQRMTMFRRAQLLAQGKGFGQSPLLPSNTWQDMSRRWPRTNALPRNLLRSLGCPVSNASLERLLIGPRWVSLPCRQDSAQFSVERWRNSRRKGHPQAKDLFKALQPVFELRALEPGRATDYNLMETILDEHVHDTHGLFLEFGVFAGASLNLIARRLRALGGGKVYGFDSFRGLPETFEGGAGWPDASKTGSSLGEGHFSLPEPPRVEENAELVIGYFNETLPGFLSGRLPENGRAPPQPLKLLHIDCDLYSSAREVLEALRPLITTGTLILLDDAVNFRGFREQVFRAFEDFLAAGPNPGKFELLGAPWTVRPEDELPTNYDGWPVESRYDLERALALRII
eukprot:TRINITY_DN9152_c0_g1_i1.p1 TRINITY_DN9152_c0_g1~~TRINITY_DN9152_c0_g1_i1.p1  ORF type:complete len:447 (+),score=60.14 TRINITY_DN9152_c0_g1_i1:42-1382(+)